MTVRERNHVLYMKKLKRFDITRNITTNCKFNLMCDNDKRNIKNYAK